MGRRVSLILPPLSSASIVKAPTPGESGNSEKGCRVEDSVPQGCPFCWSKGKHCICRPQPCIPRTSHLQFPSLSGHISHPPQPCINPSVGLALSFQARNLHLAREIEPHGLSPPNSGRPGPHHRLHQSASLLEVCSCLFVF